MMNTRRTMLGVLCAAVFVFPAAARKPFETIDLGNNQGTFVRTINANGAVLGTHGTQGFVRAPDGEITTFTGSGNCTTVAYAINDVGTITGICLAGGGFSAFVRTSDGTVTPFVGPSANTTAPNSINNEGVIVGNYQDGFGMHGFIRDASGTLNTFDVPGADHTNLVSITDKGVILGTYFIGQTGHGFQRAKNGTLTVIDDPDAGVGGTFPVAQNKSGWVTGTYYGTDAVARTFVRDPNGVFTTLADGTVPTCINKAATVSGSLDDKHGFTRRANGQMSVFDASVAHTKILTPVCINDGGTIAGNYTQKLAHHSSINYGFVRFP